MKTNKMQAIAIVTLLTVLGTSVWAQGWGKRSGNNRNGQGNRQGMNQTTALQTPLSMVEAEDLTYMREEEKLARDVYLTLYERWGIQAFSNIAASEQRHMDSLGRLIERYGLVDPILRDQIGSFQNNELSSLYAELVAKGGKSAMDALKMGALIEDLDIGDLMEALDRTEHPDVLSVYENLMRGSRNHLRAFYSLILQAGGTYQPQFISQEVLDAIVTSSTEKGGQGKGTSKDRASCSGQCDEGGQKGQGRGGRHQVGACDGECESSSAIAQRGGRGNGNRRGQNQRGGR